MTSLKATYMDWLKKIPKTDSEYSSCTCPECGRTGLFFQYFGSEGSNFGWKLVWCKSCWTGINITRTKIPGDASVITEKTNQAAFMENISGLKLVQ